MVSGFFLYPVLQNPETVKNLKRSNPKNSKKGDQVISSDNKVLFYLFLAGLFFLVTGVLSLSNYNCLFEQGGLLARLLTVKLNIAVAFVLFLVGFRLVPEPTTPSEMSRKSAYPWVAFFLAVTFYTRFSHPETPEATFWYDDLVVISDVRNILDFGIHPLLFPWGQREPFFPYFSAFLWKIFSSADGVFINRLSSSLVDLGACWGLYRLGSTIQGRRLGLWMVSLWAVSQPMIVYCFFGYGANTCILSTIWMMVFLFKLIQKPVLRRFIYLGSALGFGAFTYVPARLWTPFIIGVVWVWIVFQTRKDPKTPSNFVLLIGGILGWSFLFLSKNNVLSNGWNWVAFLNSTWVAVLIGAVLLASTVKTAVEKQKEGTKGIILGWGVFIFVTFLITSPFLFNPGYASHVSDTSALHVNQKLSIGREAIRMIWDNTTYLFLMMFADSHRDTGTYPSMVISFFEPLSTMAILIGGTYFIGRPSWRNALIFCSAVVGAMPFMLSNHAHSARFLPVMGPLLLMAGLGIEAIWTRVSVQSSSHKYRSMFLFVLFLALWALNAKWSESVVWDKWMRYKSNDAYIGEQIDKDWRQYHLVIATHYPQFEGPALTVLGDKKEVWTMQDSHPIYLQPGSISKDVVLLFWGQDQKMEQRIKKEFPSAQCSGVETANPNRNGFMKRALIPFVSLSEDPSKLMYVKKVPGEYWRRRFYWKDYGLARGLVWWDDRVPSLNSVFPKDLNVWMSGRADGEMNVKEDGDYIFQAATPGDLVQLMVDGRTVIKFRPKDGLVVAPSGKIHLTSGSHQVTYVTYFQHGPVFPNIKVLGPAGFDVVLGK